MGGKLSSCCSTRDEQAEIYKMSTYSGTVVGKKNRSSSTGSVYGKKVKRGRSSISAVPAHIDHKASEFGVNETEMLRFQKQKEKK